jgi:uncharacterized OB-fold protein
MRTGTVIAATLIRAAPAGFEPGYVVALIDTDGARELHRLDGSHGAPAPGTVVSLGRAQPRFSSAAAVSPPTARI